MKWHLMLVVMLLSSFLAIVALFGYKFYRVHQYEASRQKVGSPFDEGNRIIQALSHYKEAKGLFPESLNDLVPEFLSEIPNPNWGTGEWNYGLSEKSDFWLSVRLRKDDYIRHVYENGTWWYDQ